MENNIIEKVQRRIEMDKVDFKKYAALVNELEFLAEQNPSIFKSSDSVEKYSEIWGELEVLNACMLYEWEKCGKPNDFNKIWTKKYEKDASNMLSVLLEYLKTEADKV
jgi:hypothetical protein